MNWQKACEQAVNGEKLHRECDNLCIVYKNAGLVFIDRDGIRTPSQAVSCKDINAEWWVADSKKKKTLSSKIYTGVLRAEVVKESIRNIKKKFKDEPYATISIERVIGIIDDEMGKGLL